MNTTVPTQVISKTKTASSSPSSSQQLGSFAKEQGGKLTSSSEVASPGTREIELHPEVARAGVTVHPDSVEVPRDLAQLGVSPINVSSPVSVSPSATVTLPLSDDQVVAGLHMSVFSAIRWLSSWCVRQLKKAHVILKKVHGKIIRVRTA